MGKQSKILRRMALGVLLLCVQGMAQKLPEGVMLPTDPLPPPKAKRPPKPPFSTYLPDKASLAPATAIGLAPFGFFVPKSSYYLGRQIHLVSLDFLDENRLLFTFHPSGLMRRESEEAGTGFQRQIKALVIHLPEGKVEAEATWTVSDRARYLWMLKDGEFLLLTNGGLKQGDETLQLTPLPNLQDETNLLALSPDQQIIVTTSSDSTVSPAGSAAPISGSQFAADEKANGDQPYLELRAVDRSSGKVIFTRRAQSPLNFAVNATGYVEASSPQKYHWVLSLKSFTGGSKDLTEVPSGCVPKFTFINEREIFLTTCTPEGRLRLSAITMDWHTLWATDAPPEPVWPLVVVAPDGSRLARETLVLNDSVNLKKHPKFVKAIKGQEVKVFDAASGKVVLEAPLTPTLDGGGNVAFSPTGRRFAIVDAGAIQVFDLPPAASAPADAAH